MGAGSSIKRKLEVMTENSALAIDETNGVTFGSSGISITGQTLTIPDDGKLTTDLIEETTSGNGVNVLDKINLGSTAHAGKLMGAGESDARYGMGSSVASAISCYISSSSVADSNRGLYMRLYLAGAGGGGEAIRAYGQAGAAIAASVVRGIHTSAGCEEAGTVTGVIEPIRATLMVPNATLGGTAYGVHSEIYAEGASSTASNVALFGATVSGNSTGVTALETAGYFLNMQGFSAGAGTIINDGNTLKCKAGSADRYIPFYPAESDGIVGGCGTSASPYTMTGASKSALSFYIKTADTADSNRGIYCKLNLAGAAGGGEAGRFYGYADTGASSVPALRGIHATAEMKTNTMVTGETMALKGTVMLPAGAATGTTSGLAAELYANTATSDASNGAMFRGILNGDASGVGVLDDSAALIAIDGGTINTGNMVCATAKASATHSIRIRVNGTTLYLMAADAVS